MRREQKEMIGWRMVKSCPLLMDDQQPSSEEEKVQRLSLMGVGRKRLAVEVMDAQDG